MSRSSAGHSNDYTPGVTIPPALDPAAWPTQVAAFYAWLQAGALDDLYAPGAAVEAITGLERIARAATAAQACLAHRLAEARQTEREELFQQAVADGASIPPSLKQVDRGSGGEIGLARRISPRLGLRFLHLARDLEHLPVTSGAWQRGSITEQSAAMIATETGVLDDIEERQWVDQHLAHVLESAISHKQLTKLVKALVARVNVSAALRRGEIARRDRRVTSRPAADGMAWLTGTLPTEDAAAIMSVLDRRVKKAKADPNDQRGRGQVMADTLTELITGHLAAEHHPEPSREGGGSHEGGGDGSENDERRDSDSGRAESDPDVDAQPDADAQPDVDAQPGEQDRGYEQRHQGTRRRDTDAEAHPGDAGRNSPAPADAQSSTSDGPADADRHVDADTGTSRQDDPGTSPEPESANPGRPESAGPGTSDQGTSLSCSPGSAAAQPGSAASQPSGRPGIELRLVMSLDTFFNNDGGRGTALLNGEPLPGYLARAMLTADPDTTISLRRLFSHPKTGQLIAAESTSRTFTGGLRDLVATRDHHCRNPFCGAPIRHIDHVRADYLGGATSAINGQGLCEACNYLKESPGWRCETVDSPHPGAPSDVLLITPTGHTYTSSPPALLPTCQCSGA